MRFFRLLKEEFGEDFNKYLTISVVSGLMVALILVIIMVAMGDAEDPSIALGLAYLAVLITYVLAQYYLLSQGWQKSESISDVIRRRLSKKILQADLAGIENIGESEIFERLTQETTNISQSAVFLIPSFQSVILLIFIMIYLLFLFPLGVIALIALLAAGGWLYWRRAQKITRILKHSNAYEIRFYRILSDILNGIKEIKLFQRRKQEILKTVGKMSHLLRKIHKICYQSYSEEFIGSQLFFFVLIGAILFLLPRIVEMEVEISIKLVTSAFFIMGPVLSLAFMIPLFEKMRLSFDYIHELEERLDAIQDRAFTLEQTQEDFRNFGNIEIRDTEFHYVNPGGDRGFQIGPLNLKITKGETLFIVGGNGSGKTTMLKMLSLLYYPSSGEILINEERIGDAQIISYREMFSGIFSDFHLFAKMYGFTREELDLIKPLLKKMKLEQKTNLREDRFTTLKLSTGQRKRLAMIVTLLEDKPILIFDEWAAEQDADFREYFYDTILPELKEKGKTIFVVTHDERYQGLADRVVQMDYGKISKLTSIPA